MKMKKKKKEKEKAKMEKAIGDKKKMMVMQLTQQKIHK